MSKRVAILQSNYIPWKGYFDMINMVDEFILYDDVQYTRNDWRNRNRIRTKQGTIWLTIPVSRHFQQAIREAEVNEAGWNRKHWETIRQSYAKAPHFKEYRDRFEDLYLGSDETRLSLINHRFITGICEILGIDTRISWSMDYNLIEGKTERLVDLCRQTDAVEYISGPAARDYIQDELFEEAGIKLTYMDYSGYPEYRQIGEPFDHFVSVIDLIFNCGPDAPRYMKSF